MNVLSQPLGPIGGLLSLLGLNAVPDDEHLLHRAYKKALRADPSKASELRAAMNALATPDSRAEFLRQQSAAARALAITQAKTPRGRVQITGGEAASPELVCAYGHASLQGRRSSMEDEVLLAPLGGGRYAYGVFDGHGGPRAARMLRRHLPDALRKRASASAESLKAAFEEVDAAICARSSADGWDDGSTALVAIIGSGPPGTSSDSQSTTVTLLQLGDCDAILCHVPTVSILGEAPLLTRHRPNEPSEAQRLAALGVTVSATGRVAGLAVSRAFGDVSFKSSAQSYLIATPEVVTRVFTPEEAAGTVLVLACDGLWDFVSPAEACSILAAALEPSDASAWHADALQAAALRLADAALDKGGDDNVSVVVVPLALRFA